MKHEIDYDLLIEKINDMINLLEYDAMRSSGKAKNNSFALADLYNLKDRYQLIIDDDPGKAKDKNEEK